MTKKHDPRTCPDCREAIAVIAQWMEDPLVEELEALGMTASEARIHLHIQELMHAFQPQVLLVSTSSAGGGGGVWN